MTIRKEDMKKFRGKPIVINHTQDDPIHKGVGKQETVGEFLARGGKITYCEPIPAVRGMFKSDDFNKYGDLK